MVCQPAMPMEKRSPVSESDLSLENLFRLLLGHLPRTENRAESQTDSHAENQKNEEILYDVVLDGAHYLLIRLSEPSRPPVQLSPREQEIVRMVAQGHPNKVIADVLNISSWTVCTHLRRIFAKLGVASRAAMVARMMETSAARDPNTAHSSRHKPGTTKKASAS